MPQTGNYSVNKRGGRRTANYGHTFLQRKQTLLDRKSIEEAFFIQCGCETGCVWRAANALPDFSDRVTNLRELRFGGKTLGVAKCDHLRIWQLRFFDVFIHDGYSWDHPGGEKIVRTSGCHLLYVVALFGHETEIDRACHDVAGNVRAESEFLFEQCKNASQQSELGTIFEYKLGSVSLCRDAFMQILGLPVLNARFLRYETLLRQGVNALPLYEPRPQMRGTKQEVCCQYIHAYVLVHAEKSPREPILLLSRTPLADVESSYREHLKNTNCVEKSTFRKLWYKQLKVPLADPVSGELFDILIRRRRAVGFKACDLCCSLRFSLMMASMKKLRDIAKEKYLLHIRKVKANRVGLQRARVECDGIKVVGVSVDGADFGKFPTPTTKSKAKVLGGMHRIKNKLTGVEFFSGERKIVIFRSLPNVSTGANLTLTIFVRFAMFIAHARPSTCPRTCTCTYRLFNLGYFDQARKVYINWDGSHDNINYTCLYALVHFLLCAEKAR